MQAENDEIFRELLTELKIRGYSERTIKTYIYENMKFLDFLKGKRKEHQRPLIAEPGKWLLHSITREDIRDYEAYLVSDLKKKPASVGLILSALKFFYSTVLDRNIFYKISRPKRAKKLPTVINKWDISKMIELTSNKKHRLLIEVLYGSGLRVSEAVTLKRDDINPDQRFSILRSGKGNKDRQIIVSLKFRQTMRNYLKKREDSNKFLFNYKDSHISTRQAQRIVRNAAVRAGIRSRVFCHALRSSFATHLLDSGIDISYIQALLGHERLSTTEIYTKVSVERLRDIRSPLDRI
ncbi:tyrosine-type recombinase/integrase [Candidatus Woesearchaeota archaeon]|nr:tyrosine-type recombinase/integrase [Candidatus Woesearchaeota archaeon]